MTPHTAVFFPSLLGVGVLVSAGLLVADWSRRLLPNQGVRRRRRIALGAHGFAASIAASVGARLEAPSFVRRKPRARIVYAVAGFLLGVIAVAMMVQGIGIGRDPLSVYYRNPWPPALGIAGGSALGLAAVGCAVLAALPSDRLGPLRGLVERTPFGRLPAPDPPDTQRRSQPCDGS